MEIDPVSGNEVPVGVEPENVRDDIDAKLSTGEYVVPAQAVQFHGVDKFEKLVKSAEKGMAEMEANGRIGGEPVPSLEQEVEQAFASGGMATNLDGLVSKVRTAVEGDPTLRESLLRKGISFNEGGFVPGAWTPPGITYMQDQTGADTGVEYRIFVNEDGHRISIPFMAGQPQIPIPPGYFPEGEVEARQEQEGRDAYPEEEAYMGKHDWMKSLSDDHLMAVTNGDWDHILQYPYWGSGLEGMKTYGTDLAVERGLVDTGTIRPDGRSPDYAATPRQSIGDTGSGYDPRRTEIPTGRARYRTGVEPEERTFASDLSDLFSTGTPTVTAPSQAMRERSEWGGEPDREEQGPVWDRSYHEQGPVYQPDYVTKESLDFNPTDYDTPLGNDYSYSGNRRWRKGGFVKRPSKK